MKNKILYLFVFLVVLTLNACENTDYQVYNKDQKNKIFFEKDTVRFQYGMKLDKACDLEVLVKLIGFVDQEKAVPLRVTANEELTTAVAGRDYILPATNVFERDSSTAYLKLDFQKVNLEKNKDYVLTLDLESSEQYEPTERTRCVVIFGDKDVPAPKWWEAKKLGTYHQEKFILFVDFYHKSKELSPIIYESIKKEFGENLDEGTKANLLGVYAYQGYLTRYILTPMYEYYLESGDPVYEIPKP